MRQKTRVVLALDQATHTGYAIYKNREIIESGVVRLNSTSREKDLDDFLVKICKRYKVTDIVAEDIHKKKGYEYAFEVLACLKGVINRFCQSNDIISLTYQQAIHMQRFVLGHTIDGNEYKRKLSQAKGNSFKTHQIEEAHRTEVKNWVKKRIENLGYKLTSNRDDESDAIGHLLLYVKTNELSLELPTGEMFS